MSYVGGAQVKHTVLLHVRQFGTLELQALQ